MTIIIKSLKGETECRQDGRGTNSSWEEPWAWGWSGSQLLLGAGCESEHLREDIFWVEKGQTGWGWNNNKKHMQNGDLVMKNRYVS